MKIKSTIKLDSVKETILPLLEKKFIIEPLVVILIFIILLLPIPSKNHPIITIGCVIGIVVQFLSFHVLIKSKIKVGTKYFTKTYPNNEYLLTIKLNKKDMVFENEYFTKSVKINYTDIAKIKGFI